MDISAARTFLEIVKTGSFVSAAANLNLTQTAVSARIRVLEEQLDRPLFVRNKAGARLTAAGEQFLRFATTMVLAWERARKAVALPPGRQMVVTIGAELSLWDPFLREWMVWMRHACPEYAVNAQIDDAERLVDRVQAGLLDVAIVYAAPQRPGVVAELLFQEKLVMVSTTSTQLKHPLQPEDHVRIDWGDAFAVSYQAAFPEQPNPVVSTSYGPLALDYILAVGGSGYFRKGFVRRHLEDGRLALVPDSPEFSYSAYAVHSAKADKGVMERIREGLRAASPKAVEERVGSST
ncbi:LysR family transcriptional regulator [Dyella mobilis]|uniref:LysR family transcriptional regulator n=1 Tax=Dyella mobilis TaxID=1849582 RepID=A0ABS2KFI6_9GAMM|nr:LysR family transcriptional regulator [Dyella mobilis]MBM7129916.1 LysR family transcriptional regulator [Dyella mobilis]GLQ97821.1 transcriptional regulator [Dyella mobilis]